MKGSWSTAEAWHCERPRKGQWWRGHAKKLRLNTTKKVYERLLVKVQPSCSRKSQRIWDASTMGWLPRTVAAVEWNQSEPRVPQRTELEEWPKSFGGARRHWNKKPEPWDTFWGKLITGSGTSPRERIVLQSTKLKGVGHQTWRCRAWSFPSCFFGLVLVQYCLIIMFSNGNVYPVPWYIGSIWSAFCFCIYMGLQLRDHLFLRKDIELQTFNIGETVIYYRDFWS